MRYCCAVVVVCCLLFYSHVSLALTWADLWQRNDQQVEKLIEQNLFDEAESRADSVEQSALVKYRAEDYKAAAELYDQRAQNYNSATALVRAGEYNAAVEAYDQVLADSPEYEDAMHNRKIAQQLAELQNQEDGDGQQGSEQSQQNDDKTSGENSDDSQGQSAQQEKGSGQDGAQSEENSGEDSESDESSDSEDETDGDEQQNESEKESQTSLENADGKPHDEEQQAMDQWLQRVPDDPAGLLRARIFREHRRSYGNSGDRVQAW